MEAARALAAAGGEETKLQRPAHAELARRKLIELLEHSRTWRDLYEGKGQGKGRNGRPRDAKGFAFMRKHYGVYCRGFPGAARARRLLGEAGSVSEAIEVAQGLLREFEDELRGAGEEDESGGEMIER